MWVFGSLRGRARKAPALQRSLETARGQHPAVGRRSEWTYVEALLSIADFNRIRTVSSSSCSSSDIAS